MERFEATPLRVINEVGHAWGVRMGTRLQYDLCSHVYSHYPSTAKGSLLPPLWLKYHCRSPEKQSPMPKLCIFFCRCGWEQIIPVSTKNTYISERISDSQYIHIYIYIYILYSRIYIYKMYIYIYIHIWCTYIYIYIHICIYRDTCMYIWYITIYIHKYINIMSIMIQNPISCLMFLQLVHWLRDGKTTLADRRPPVCQIMPDPQIPRSICDAVVQVDNDMNILDSDKLSLLLYQNSTRFGGNVLQRPVVTTGLAAIPGWHSGSSGWRLHADSS